MRNRFAVVLCLASSTLLPSLLHGQDKRASTARDSGFVLDAGEHDLADILDKAAKFLGRNILFHGDEKNTKAGRARRGGAGGVAESATAIRLQKKLILDAIACEEVISQLAYSRGFVIVPIDALRGIYEVISMTGQKSQTLRSRFQQMTAEEVKRRSRQRILVGTTVKLEHISAQNASTQLRPFFSRSNSVGEVQIGLIGGSILLSGFAQNVAGALRLLEAADVPDGNVNTQGNQNGQVGYLQQQLQQQAYRSQRLELRVKQLEILLGKRQLTVPKPSKKVKAKASSKAVEKRGPVRRQE